MLEELFRCLCIYSIGGVVGDGGLARRLVSVGAPRVADVDVGDSVCVDRR